MKFIKYIAKNYFLSFIMKKLSNAFPGMTYYKLAGYASVIAIIIGGTSIMSGIALWWLWEFLFFDQVIAWILMFIGYVLIRLGDTVSKLQAIGEDKVREWFSQKDGFSEFNAANLC